jgi:hypothetical protein
MPTHQNFMICGHGQLLMNEDMYLEVFEEDDGVSVITFATPTATCVYIAEHFPILREELHAKHSSMPTIKDYAKGIKDAEIKLFGHSYCSDVWVGVLGKKDGYDTKKSCGIQQNTIQEKYFTFEDDSVEPGILGFWGLDHNINLFDSGFPVVPRIHNNKKYYKFSNIMHMLRLVYPDCNLNVLDCTCNIVDGITDARSQRRFSRRILASERGGTRKRHKRGKRSSSKKHF